MIFLCKNKDKFLNSFDEILKEYGVTKLVGRYRTPSKDKIIKRYIEIFFICDDCKEIKSFKFRGDYSLLREDKLVCRTCKIKKTKIKRYGKNGINVEKSKKTKLERYGDENYNNFKKVKETKLERYGDPFFRDTEKTKETNLKRYGMEGTPRKGINKGVPKTIEHKEKLSINAKERFKNKENHPLYGYHFSEESKKKMSESNSKTWAQKVLNGDLPTNKNYKSGYFYSNKMKKNFYYRSSYEEHLIFLLEICESVVSYKLESIAIPYTSVDNNIHHYIPDILIEWNNGSTHLIEVKPKNLQETEINLLKFESAKNYVKENNEIDEYKILDFGEMFKYICQNYDDNVIPFPPWFMEELNNITTNLKEVA